jgi:hypothetical protein
MLRIITIGLLVVSYLAATVPTLVPMLNYSVNYEWYAEERCINKDVPYSDCDGECALMDDVVEQVDHTVPGAPMQVLLLTFSIDPSELLTSASPAAPLCVVRLPIASHSDRLLEGIAFVREQPPNAGTVLC